MLNTSDLAAILLSCRCVYSFSQWDAMQDCCYREEMLYLLTCVLISL